MYSVLIADDNAAIRAGLCVLIDWNALGFDTPVTAPNGVEALEILQSDRISLLIADVRMPLMDGIELLKRVCELGLKTRCIILSAYRDFEYAQMAMEYRAIRYLVKPINEERLVETLNTVRAELDAESESASADSFDQLIEYIGLHLREKLSLKELSAIFHYNPAYLGRLFLRRTGVNFNAYLNRCRLDKAERLLRQTHIAVHAVAEESGFPDGNRLAVAFKQKFGLSPLAYRAKAQQGRPEG